MHPSNIRSFSFQSLVPQKVRFSQNLSEKIYNYGIDNVYPQKMQQIAKESGVTSQAIALYQDFLFGEGFVDEMLSDIVVNEKGQTLDELLDDVTKSIATFNGVALHFNYNLLGQITSITQIPFPYCRLGDLNSEHAYKIAVWDNWGGESYNNVNNTRNIIVYLPCIKDKLTEVILI